MSQNVIDGEQVQVVEPEVLSFGDTGLAEVARQAESRVKAMKTIMLAALRFTHAGDWTDIGGRPYLNSSGAEKIAAIGVKVDRVSRTKLPEEDDEGRYYIWEYIGTFAIAGRSIEAIGTCSSRDEFFAKRDGQLVALQFVDQTNIMKAAYSNMLVNGITRLLGLRNPSWEDLQAAGIDLKGVGKVEFGKGTQGAASADDKAMQREVAEKLMEIAGGDKTVAQNMLETLTAFTGKDKKQVPGIKETHKLRGKRLEIALEKVRKEYERAKAEGDIPAGSDGEEKSYEEAFGEEPQS